MKSPGGLSPTAFVLWIAVFYIALFIIAHFV